MCMRGNDCLQILSLNTGVLVSFPCSYAQLSDQDFELIMKGKAEMKDFVKEEPEEEDKKWV